jgi:hypothetical protein
MLLKKCPNCKTYTLKEICKRCNNKTINPHYKFKKVKDAPKDSSKHFTKIRNKKS